MVSLSSEEEWKWHHPINVVNTFSQLTYVSPDVFVFCSRCHDRTPGSADYWRKATTASPRSTWSGQGQYKVCVWGGGAEPSLPILLLLLFSPSHQHISKLCPVLLLSFLTGPTFFPSLPSNCIHNCLVQNLPYRLISLAVVFQVFSFPGFCPSLRAAAF